MFDEIPLSKIKKIIYKLAMEKELSKKEKEIIDKVKDMEEGEEF